jgi:hypothetical protein
MDSEEVTYMRERQAKQDYLKEQIADKFYNTVDFAEYLLEQKGKSLFLYFGALALNSE